MLTCCTHRRGFTLVELLVVIGLIALLIGMLMPSLTRVREYARTVQCASQLRQIGTAVYSYANNHRGWTPAWSNWHVAGGDGTGEDSPGPGWTERLERDLGAGPLSPIYNCPSFPEEYRINYFITGRYAAVTGRRAIKLTEIKLSTQFVLGGDCTQPKLYPPTFGTAFSNVEDDCDKDDATQNGVPFQGEPGGMNVHRGGNNILFADGHVALFGSFQPDAMTYHPTKLRDWANAGMP
jgi:prepilin-type N-terminal cleavage/methylation domain-containing protein/prepilin-type processing-associated H-X9-DG protein